MVKAIEGLVALGTQSQLDPKDNQRIRLVNKICLLVILIIIPHTLLTLYYRSSHATLVQLAAIIHLGLAIFLNSRHFHRLAKALALVVGNFHIANVVLLLGIDTGVYFYFSAAIIAPLFFYTAKEYKTIAGFALLTTILALLVHTAHPHLPPLIRPPVMLLTLFFYFSVLGSLFTVFIFVLHFYNESNRLERSLTAVNNKLRLLSETDSLTQLPNRRALFANLDREWGRAIRNTTPLSLIMMDVDHFKWFNDQYGHQEGDRCLERIAQAVSENVREFVDFPARYGGEEFFVLLSNTTLDQAEVVAERIRREVLTLGIPHQQNEPDCLVTCSLGIASCRPDGVSQPAELIGRADTALFAAKRNGRNRVEWHAG